MNNATKQSLLASSTALVSTVIRRPNTTLTNDVMRNIFIRMIKSFTCRETEKHFNDRDVKTFRSISKKARIKLEILNATVSLERLKVPPGNRLEALKGNRKGQYSIRIDTQWRICFKWLQGNTYEVEIVDYH